MCGIAGMYRLNPREHADESLVRRMTGVLAHRGPDGEGFHFEGRIGLGHRRLAIIDLATGAQPVSNEDGTISLVSNQEIYNFRELRRELAAQGHAFRTRSDTEVMVHAYEEWGPECVSRFAGMFAFALWDARGGRLVLGRDRLGVKPLYYAIVDNTLLFASEIKSLLCHPAMPREPDLEAVSSYLGYRCVLGDGTLFKGIEKLTAGHLLVAERDCIRKIRYWSLPLERSPRDLGEAYYAKKVRSLLARAVRRRMVSDVPVGAYLSGGLDSSIVVALMANERREPVSTYTVAFRADGYDERSYAKLVADRHATRHREIVVDESGYADLIPQLVRMKDAPLAVANEVPLYLLSRELRRDVTVVLSGEGADELFGGYGRIFRSPFDYARARFLEDNPELLPQLRGTFLNKLREIYGVSLFLNEQDHFMRKYHWMSSTEKEALLSPEMLEHTSGDRRAREFIAARFREAEGLSHTEKLLHFFQTVHLENLLQRVDAMTMAASVEARVPFVDHELVEFVFSMPLHYKLRWKSAMHEAMAGLLAADEMSERFDTTKYILRKAFAGDLPAEVLERRKVGFPVPLASWLGGRWEEMSRDILLDRRTRERGIFNVRAITERLREERRTNAESLTIWMLVNLEIWFREYIDRGAAGVLSESPAEAPAQPRRRQRRKETVTA